jgi:hypothetical protein
MVECLVARRSLRVPAGLARITRLLSAEAGCASILGSVSDKAPTNLHWSSPGSAGDISIESGAYSLKNFLLKKKPLTPLRILQIFRQQKNAARHHAEPRLYCTKQILRRVTFS